MTCLLALILTFCTAWMLSAAVIGNDAALWVMGALALACARVWNQPYPSQEVCREGLLDERTDAK